MIESLVNTVINDDCLNVMRQLPDKCIDFVLTDPPYGIGEDGGKNRRMQSKHKKLNWDKKPDKIYFQEIKRISKNQIIWGGNYFTDFLYPSSCWLCWDKKLYNSDFSDFELAWTSFNSGCKIFIKCKNGGNIKLFKESHQHPTQKPVSLFQWILQNYSTPGMTIFDPFAGSGTTAIACLETGRNYILVEKEKEYFDIINNRIDTWKSQLRMF